MTMGQGSRSEKHYAIPHEPPPPNADHIKGRLSDISYARLSSAQKLAIYLPDEGEGPFPVIVWIHGGAFMGGDKADVLILPSLEGLKRNLSKSAAQCYLCGQPAHAIDRGEVGYIY
jgi:hypothetical protein